MYNSRRPVPNVGLAGAGSRRVRRNHQLATSMPRDANLTRQQIESLKSDYAIEREEAMRNIVYAAMVVGRDEGLDKASWSLYNIYRFDRNESHRILSLAVIHAVGNENVMRLVAQHLPFETSPPVRRITKAVVLEHFGG